VSLNLTTEATCVRIKI